MKKLYKKTELKRSLKMIDCVLKCKAKGLSFQKICDKCKELGVGSRTLAYRIYKENK